MKYLWDENKNEANIKKHGIDFFDVPPIFQLPMLRYYDTKLDYGEDRWIGMGLLKTIVIVVVYTEPSEDTIRIISARKAKIFERKKYETQIKNEF